MLAAGLPRERYAIRDFHSQLRNSDRPDSDVTHKLSKAPWHTLRCLGFAACFVLPAEDVDRLREVAGRLMRDSPAFQSVVREFGGLPAK